MKNSLNIKKQKMIFVVCLIVVLVTVFTCYSHVFPSNAATWKKIETTNGSTGSNNNIRKTEKITYYGGHTVSDAKNKGQFTVQILRNGTSKSKKLSVKGSRSSSFSIGAGLSVKNVNLTVGYSRAKNYNLNGKMVVKAHKEVAAVAKWKKVTYKYKQVYYIYNLMGTKVEKTKVTYPTVVEYVPGPSNYTSS